jgi:Second Messenger Oligonucleotide or Dinucleotide Synthetase domain
MAKTVYEGIQQYLEWLQPSAAEVEKRKSHKKTIEQALAAEFTKFNEVLIIGSHTRDTAIHIHSDVDYFGKLGIDDVTRGGWRVGSTSTLDRTKRALQARLQQTNIWVDGPAVVVGFGQGEGAVDVVPGVWVGTTNTAPQYPVYEIPDGAGNWLRTSPQRHAKYLRDEDERAGGKLSRTIKLLKGWKYARSPKVPVLGFHLELLIASEGVCVGPKSYQNCLNDAFRLLRDRAGAALNDPLNISGRIPATNTEAQRQALTTATSYAHEKSSRALDAEIAGGIAEAFDYWDVVFNGQFPSR